MQTSQIHPSTPFNLRAALRSKQTALPAEHGAWVFLLSPLAVGLAIGGWRPASAVLIAGLLAAFLIRQPVTMLVKVMSGRRPKSELPAALFWLAVYGLLGAAAAAGLALLDYAWLFWLALPVLPIFAWHLALVSQRAERRQMWVEILGGGVLALAAPAAFWLGQGRLDPAGWLLWGLCWLQTGGSIVYAYLRLAQRVLPEMPARREALRMAAPALWANWGGLLMVAALALARLVPAWLLVAFAIQPLEAVWGALHPAVGVRPKAIGFRQLAVSALFTLAFIAAWGRI